MSPSSVQRRRQTTTLQTISGLIRPKNGSIIFKDQDLPTNRPRTLSIRDIPGTGGPPGFANLTVAENLEMGAYLRKDKEGIKATLEKVYASFPACGKSKPAAGTLSGGEQQMLAMGRALMSQPTLLLLTGLHGTGAHFSTGNLHHYPGNQ